MVVTVAAETVAAAAEPVPATLLDEPGTIVIACRRTPTQLSRLITAPCRHIVRVHPPARHSCMIVDNTKKAPHSCSINFVRDFIVHWDFSCE